MRPLERHDVGHDPLKGVNVEIYGAFEHMDHPVNIDFLISMGHVTISTISVSWQSWRR